MRHILRMFSAHIPGAVAAVFGGVAVQDDSCKVISARLKRAGAYSLFSSSAFSISHGCRDGFSFSMILSKSIIFSVLPSDLILASFSRYLKKRACLARDGRFL